MAKQSGSKKAGIFIDMLETFLTSYIPCSLGLSPNTEASYTLTFKLLIIYMKDIRKVSSHEITFFMLDISTITGFLDWLEKSRNNSITTRNARLAALKSFAKYAETHNFDAAACFAKTMRKIQPKRGLNKGRAYFSLPEVKILISLPNLNTISGRRDAVLLAFMFVTGARGQEICDLKVRDIALVDNGRAKVTLTGKGRSTRKIIICEEVTRLLQKYMKYRGITNIPDSYVFCTQNNPRMSVSCIEEIFNKYVAEAKAEYPELFAEDRYSPHSMRHTTATSMLAAGVSLSAIQVFLGHKSILTTQIYAEYTQPALDEVIIKWNQSFWSHVDETNLQMRESEPEAGTDGIPNFLKRRRKAQ